MSALRSRTAAGLVLLSGAALVLAGCGSSGGGSDNNAANGPANADPSALALSTPYVRPKVADAGPITVAVDEATANYNDNLGSTSDIADLYVDGLLQPSVFFANDVANVTKVQLDGDLMDSVKVLSTSPEVIEYNIKQQAVWSDGAPIDCSDFYLQWLAGAVDNGDISTAFNNNISGLDHINKVDCSNNNKTVTVHFDKPWADWQALFSNMMPAHVVEQGTGVPDVTKLNDTNPADHDALIKVANFYSGGPQANQGFAGLNTKLDLSAGPFMLQSFDGKSETVLVRNPKWWGNPAGPSKLDIRVNTDDESAFQQLENKEIQIVGSQPDAAVAQQVNASGGQYKLVTGIGVTFEHLDYSAQNGAFKQYPELRKALSLCVNRQDIITKVVADVDPAIKPLGEVLFLPTEKPYTDHYANVGNGDEAAAKQVLQQAGWSMGPDGFMQKNGQDAEITIGHKTVQRRSATVQAIQAECRQAGIKIDDHDSAGFNANDLQHGNFQVALFAWTGTPYKAPFTSIYHSNNGGALGNENYMRYSDPKVDQLLLQADGELNWTNRVQELQQADQLIAQDGFTLPLFPLPEFAITDGSISSTDQTGKQVGIQDNEASNGVLWDAFTWTKTKS